MSNPIVSVVIPARDCLAYLPGAFASIAAQNVENLEIIVIDDGSTDGTAAWLQAQKAHWPMLTVLTGQGDGPNVSRNRGIAAARGELIAFLDADDRWTDGKLAEQIAYHLANPAVVFSFTDYRHVDPNGGDHGPCFGFWPHFFGLASQAGAGWHRLDNPAAAILAENVVGTSTVVVRRWALMAVDGFDSTLVSAADWDLWLRLCRIGSVGFSSQIGMAYLMRPGSVSSNTAARLACMQRIIDRHVAEGDPKLAAAARRARARIHTGEAEQAMARGRPGKALVQQAVALALAPSHRALRATAAMAVGFLATLPAARRTQARMRT